jgi:hypothetical protein
MIIKTQKKREFGSPGNFQEERILTIKFFNKLRPQKGGKTGWSVGTRTKIANYRCSSIIKY